MRQSEGELAALISAVLCREVFPPFLQQRDGRCFVGMGSRWRMLQSLDHGKGVEGYL
jgi:hypothetical protein